MGNHVGEVFANLLRGNSTLRYLNLSRNQLRRSVLHFAWALTPNAPTRHNATLTSLALGGHDLRDGRAVALATALRRNTTLTELDLYESIVGRDEVHALTDALRTNTTLTELDLRAISFWGERILGDILRDDALLRVRVLSSWYP